MKFKKRWKRFLDSIFKDTYSISYLGGMKMTYTIKLTDKEAKNLIKEAKKQT